MFSFEQLCELVKPFEAAIRAGENPAPLIDYLAEHGCEEAAQATQGKLFKIAGRGKLRGPVAIEPTTEDYVRAVWQDRHDRTTHPEGRSDNGSRWYPSDREDCDGSGSNARGPSRAWPWSYMLRCRSRDHVRNLVAAALRGEDVPPDVIHTPGEWRLWAIRQVLWEITHPTTTVTATALVPA
jgi:hypothetical protein